MINFKSILHEDQCNISVSSFYDEKYGRRNFSRKSKSMFYIQLLFFFFRKSYLLWNNVERYGSDRQTTDDNVVRRILFAFWVTKATDIHSAYVTPIAFPR
jgi:hypothetical protein